MASDLQLMQHLIHISQNGSDDECTMYHFLYTRSHLFTHHDSSTSLTLMVKAVQIVICTGVKAVYTPMLKTHLKVK